MNVKFRALFLPCFFLILAAWSQAQPPNQSASFRADHDSIRILGRTMKNSSGNIHFDWPGVSVKFNFSGSYCALKMDDSGKNFYNVFIDDLPLALHSVYSDTILVLAENLPQGKHSLTLTKRTEGNQGLAEFKGVILSGEGSLLSPPESASRKIEFIGNSITCGYGAESETKTEAFKAETENNYKSYAAIIGRAFDAECHMIAHSGQGVVRNYGYADPVSPYTMPDRYRQVLDNKPEPAWNFSDWVPDMVVINLGTNDFSTAPHPQESVFNRAYTNLISFIRANYGSIPVFCIVGPMTDEPCYSYVKKMVEGNRSFLNDKNIYFIGIPPYLLVEEDWGAWHPNYSGHLKMAHHAIPVISAVTGWEVKEGVE